VQRKRWALGSNGNATGHVRFASFDLDIETGELRKHGKPLRLQPQPSKVLAALVSRPGELVTREQLRHRIWDGTTFVDFEQGLNFCIRQIRLALDDDTDAPRFIETVPRRGYRFVAPTLPANGEPELPQAPALPQNEKKKAGFIGTFALLLAVGIAAGLGGLALYRSRETHLASRSEWVQLTNFTDSATSPVFSPDGRLLAFIRGPDTFASPGQVYVELLPSGAPVQLTHDALLKMSPVFSPDGSRIAYSVGVKWDTWMVPVLGGEPRLMLPNASGLTWIDKGRVLFSEIKSGRHMGLVTATESRAEARDVYLPADQAGMAHRSVLSPDGKWLLLAEMDSIHGWLPCRLLPFDGSSPGTPIGAPGGHCTSVAWSPDGRWMYFSADSGDTFHIWRQRFPDGKLEQVSSGPTEQEGIAMAPDGRSFVTSVGMVEGTVWLHDHNTERQISSEGYAEAPSVSADGKRFFYLMRARGRGGPFAAGLLPRGELWVKDLSTNDSQALLPGFPVTGYSVSRDRQRVVCSTLDGNGRSHLWLTSLDRRNPPVQLRSSVSESEDKPIFASNGDLLFRGSEAGAYYLYRMKMGATLAEKVTTDAIIEPQSVSPDGRWAVAQVTLSGKETPRGVVAYPAQGGPPLPLCRAFCIVSWAMDGRSMYIHLPGTSQRNDFGKTFVLAVQPDNPFPVLPSAGLRSEADLRGLPGMEMVEGVVFPGPNSSVYAFTRQSVHRNLYRIPIP
jgi:DNA-binding winged helix-turn-helix (wHTH) protein/Tol biopolymer transport system component